MDEIVRQAMAKWPNVPDCYGWLGLDARGQWFMRDVSVQALGAFPSFDPPGAGGARGELLGHRKLIEFIHRNYACDVAGQWFFQNGPQRVYVELEATPWIWRLDAYAGNTIGVTAQTGQTTQALRCLVDEHGRVYLETRLGLGLVHTLDVALIADRIDQGQWQPESVTSAALPALFGFVRSPMSAYAPAVR